MMAAPRGKRGTDKERLERQSETHPPGSQKQVQSGLTRAGLPAQRRAFACRTFNGLPLVARGQHHELAGG